MPESDCSLQAFVTSSLKVSVLSPFHKYCNKFLSKSWQDFPKQCVE